MRRASTAALLFVLLVAGTGPAVAGPVEQAKAKIAKVWVEYGRWCKAHRLKEEAEGALARAAALDPEAKDLAALREEVKGLPADVEPPAGLERRREKANKAAARAYARLARVVDGDEAGLWLSRALALHADKRTVKMLASEARRKPVLVQAPGHPMVGFLSLPRGWSPRRSYPVLVSVEGAGCNFAGNHRRFATARGSRKYIVLTPVSLSNTNALQPKKYPHYGAKLLSEHDRNRIAFDLAGLNALLAFAKEHLGADEKIGITGFSGGGNLCYGFLARHPDRVRFAAPACANFSGQGYRDAEPVEDGGPPVHIMTGENDPHREFTHGNENSPGIEPQTDRAVEALKRLGFTKVKRTMLPGKGHATLAAEVWAFTDEQE